MGLVGHQSGVLLDIAAQWIIGVSSNQEREAGKMINSSSYIHK